VLKLTLPKKPEIVKKQMTKTIEIQ